MGCGASNGAANIAPSSAEETQRNKDFAQKIKASEDAKKQVIKVLLLGAGECGKSTILKQMKIINLKETPTPEEMKEARELVWKNTLDSIQSLCAACRDLNIPYETDGNAEKAAALLKVDSSSTIPLEIADDIIAVWDDEACKKAKAREAEFHLLDSAVYFLTRVKEYFVPDFEACAQDQLRSRLTTTGIIETAFDIDKQPIKMYDVGGQRGERKKWIHCFDDVTAIMFIAAMSEYNQVLAEDRTRNRMLESLDLFEGIANLKWFVSAAIILFLNKKDLFEIKIVKIDMGDFHEDYDGGLDYDNGCKYIKEQYEDRRADEDKKLYTHVTDATDTRNVEVVWEMCQNIILEQKLKESGLEM